MSKSFEQLPDFNSRIETVTFLRVLAEDIEQGNIQIKGADISKYWDCCVKGISVNIETTEERY